MCSRKIYNESANHLFYKVVVAAATTGSTLFSSLRNLLLNHHNLISNASFSKLMNFHSSFLQDRRISIKHSIPSPLSSNSNFLWLHHQLADLGLKRNLFQCDRQNFDFCPTKSVNTICTAFFSDLFQHVDHTMAFELIESLLPGPHHIEMPSI